MKKLRICLIITALSFFAACEHPNEQPKPWADLSGYIELYDEDFNRIAEVDSVKVSLEGTERFVYTGKNFGSFFFKNPPLGKQRLVFEKEGYGTVKRYINVCLYESNVQHAALFPKIFKYHIENFSASAENNYLHLKGDIPGANQPYLSSSIHFFISDKLDKNYPEYYVYNPQINVGWISSWKDFSARFPLSYIYDNTDLKPGDTIYIIAYMNGTGFGEDSWYFDEGSDKIIFPCLSKPSNIAAVKLP